MLALAVESTSKMSNQLRLFFKQIYPLKASISQAFNQ